MDTTKCRERLPFHDTKPRSHIALPSGNDRLVPIIREPLCSRLNLQSTSFQSEISRSTELDSTDILELVTSRLTDKKRVDQSINVKCTEAKDCDPGGEFVSIGFRRKELRTTISRWGIEQEPTQPGERSSEFAGLTQQC